MRLAHRVCSDRLKSLALAGKFNRAGCFQAHGSEHYQMYNGQNFLLVTRLLNKI